MKLTFEDLKDHKFVFAEISGFGIVKLKVVQNVSTNSKNEDGICFRLKNKDLFFDVFDQKDVDNYKLYSIIKA